MVKMMHLVIYFCGTGEELTKGDKDNFAYLSQNPKVSTLFVKGCHDKEVCGSSINPNLNKFAKRFMDAFEIIKEGPNKGKLKLKGDLDTLKDLGIGISSEFSTVRGEDLIIDDITLTGFSRGGVTCFEIAKQLQELESKKPVGGKDEQTYTPVDIIAAEPVPGNSYNVPGTNARSIANCTHLKNLQHSTVILGAYTGQEVGEGRTGLSRYLISVYHKGFFSQIVPRLPYTTKKDLIITPRGSHFDDRYKMATSMNHLHLQLAKYSSEKKLVSEETVTQKRQEVELAYKGYKYSLHPMTDKDEDIQWYQFRAEVSGSALLYKVRLPRENEPTPPRGEIKSGFIPLSKLGIRPPVDQERLKTLLPQILSKANQEHLMSESETPPITFMHNEERLQGIYGLEKRDVYKHLDPYHPEVNLPWDPSNDQTLLAWWNKHEEAISKEPSKLTKELVKVIGEAEVNNSDSMIAVFKEADRWLLKKADSSSARYYQVQCLRDNVRDYLIKNDASIEDRLNKINRHNLVETDYLRQHWKKASRAASYFKSDETKALDEAFFKHSLPPPSLKKDHELRDSLNDWIEKKKGTTSKRLELVSEMIERMDDVVKGYSKEEKQAYEAGNLQKQAPTSLIRGYSN